MEHLHQSIMIIFGGFYCTIGILSLLINVLLFYTFKKVPFYSKLPFYTIARQLIICDIAASIIHLYVGAPSTFFERNIYQSIEPFNTLYNCLLFLEFTAYKGTIVFVLLMAIHRVFIFMIPSIEKRTFRGKWLMVWILSAWLYISLTTIVISLFGCRKTFSYTQYFFHWDCDDGTFSNDYSQLFSGCGQVVSLVGLLDGAMGPHMVNIIESYVIPLLTLTLNCSIVFFISYSYKNLTNSSNRPAKQEITVLLQNFCLCALIMLHAISFNIFGSISSANQHLSVYLTLLQNVISVSTCMLHPLIYLIFNKKVRKDVHSVFSPTVVHPIGTQSALVYSRHMSIY